VVVAGVVLEDDVEIEDIFNERVVVPFRNGRKRVTLVEFKPSITTH
jgi:hypothetical protein